MFLYKNIVVAKTKKTIKSYCTQWYSKVKSINFGKVEMNKKFTNGTCQQSFRSPILQTVFAIFDLIIIETIF